MLILINMSVLGVPLRKLLIRYMGKHTLSKDETYLHFLQIVYSTDKIPTVINIAMITVFKNTICFSCSMKVSSQFGGKVGSLKVNSFPF